MIAATLVISSLTLLLLLAAIGYVVMITRKLRATKTRAKTAGTKFAEAIALTLSQAAAAKQAQQAQPPAEPVEVPRSA